MSKFIKVTDAKNGDISYHNASSITCFRDGEIWIGNEFADIVETAEQIESQLLRDEFAMAALIGMLSYGGDDQRGSHHNNNSPSGVAQMSYEYADAMLKERIK